MRLRISARRDVSVPLGWAAVVLEAAALLTLAYSYTFDHLGHTSYDPQSSLVAVHLWLVGAGVAVVTLCVVPVTDPRGRGWRPALGALAILLIFVFVLFRQRHELNWLGDRPHEPVSQTDGRSLT